MTLAIFLHGYFCRILQCWTISIENHWLSCFYCCLLLSMVKWPARVAKFFSQILLIGYFTVRAFYIIQLYTSCTLQSWWCLSSRRNIYSVRCYCLILFCEKIPFMDNESPCVERLFFYTLKNTNLFVIRMNTAPWASANIFPGGRQRRHFADLF